MNHEPIYVPVASGAGRIDCTCGWRGKVQDDGHMFDPGAYNAAKAFEGHVGEHTPHYNYACPNCNSPHNMRIVATVRVKLVQHGDDVFETELDDDEHDWDSESSVECLACGWLGLMEDAEVEEST